MNKLYISILTFTLLLFPNLYSQNMVNSLDKNELYFSQELFLENNSIITLNNVFIKHWIGINMENINNNGVTIDNYPFMVKGLGAMRDDSMIITKNIQESPVIINGKEYSGNVINLTTQNNVRLLSASQIKKIFFPQIKDPCIYMVNQFFITDDVEAYRFESDFILKVIAMKSTDFEAMKDFPALDIIRIYTKTQRNYEDHPITE